MNTRFGLLLGLAALGLLCAIGTAAADDNTTGTQGMQLVDDIQAYNGSIGADSSLYGLKIAFENLDDSFTFNQSERLVKEAGHADLRLAELKSALASNRTDAADRALDQYWQNLNQTEGTLERFTETRPMPAFGGTGSTPAPADPGLVHVQDMLITHQVVLENLSSHYGNPGLEQAYDNSRELEMKFEQKTQTQVERVQGADNRIWLRAIPLSPGTQEPVQKERVPGYGEVRSGPHMNRTVTDTGNPGREMTGQIPGGTNQSWQDQHRTAIHVIPGHGQSFADRQDSRNETPSGTDNTGTNRNDYRYIRV